MPKCDMSLEREDIEEEPIAGGMTFHQIGLILTALFAAIATAISFFLMYKHSTNYSKPAEQRHIIRILFMIPIYGVVSFLEYYFYHESVYYEVLRDCYEAFAIASFFALLCSYIAPDIHEQKNYFRALSPKNWVWPMTWAQKCTGGKDKGWLRRPQSGLTWFNVIWVGVFHYCFIRVFFTIVSVTAEAAGVYCESSLSPAFASVWAQLFNAVAVSIAMYCLIQFYVQLKQDLAEHKPFLKVLSIKLVIFFVFWQSLVIDFLSSNGPLKPSKTLAYADVKVGISCVLVAIEMTFFSILHIFSFPYKPYTGKPSQGGKFGFKAIMNAFNPWDIIKAIGRGFRWLFVGRRHRHKDVSYRQSTAGASHEMHDNKFNDADNASLESQSDHMGPGYQGVDQTSPPRHNGRRYDEDGHAGLLDYAAPHPADSYPESSYLSQSAESTAGPLSYGNPSHNMPYSTQYGGYHSSGAQPSAPYAEDAPGGPQVDPRYYAAAGTGRPAQQPTTAGGNWDMFGGVLGQGQGQGQGRPGGGPPGHAF